MKRASPHCSGDPIYKNYRYNRPGPRSRMLVWPARSICSGNRIQLHGGERQGLRSGAGGDHIMCDPRTIDWSGLRWPLD